jgi:hypothetical protein
VQGHNYPVVETFAENKVLGRIFKILSENAGYPMSNSLRFLHSASQRNKNQDMYSHEPLENYTIYLSRKNAKEFFSLFKHICPTLDQFRINVVGDNKKHKNFSEEEIERVFYSGESMEAWNEGAKTFKQLANQFLVDNNSKNGTYSTRRVSILFGYYADIKIPFSIKLVYVKNGRDFGRGILRMHFTYLTFDNGVITHCLPSEKRKGVHKDKEIFKRKKLTQEEKIKLEMMERLEMEELFVHFFKMQLEYH